MCTSSSNQGRCQRLQGSSRIQAIIPHVICLPANTNLNLELWWGQGYSTFMSGGTQVAVWGESWCPAVWEGERGGGSCVTGISTICHECCCWWPRHVTPLNLAGMLKAGKTRLALHVCSSSWAAMLLRNPISSHREASERVVMLFCHKSHRACQKSSSSCDSIILWTCWHGLDAVSAYVKQTANSSAKSTSKGQLSVVGRPRGGGAARGGGRGRGGGGGRRGGRGARGGGGGGGGGGRWRYEYEEEGRHGAGSGVFEE